MLVRIVKMSFHENNRNVFLENFNKHKEKIRNFEGCRLLELYQDKNDPSIYFSYSYWESENHLEMYRNSTFFKEIWNFTKTLFNNKPDAWSVTKIESLI